MHITEILEVHHFTSPFEKEVVAGVVGVQSRAFRRNSPKGTVPEIVAFLRDDSELDWLERTLALEESMTTDSCASFLDA